VVSDVVSTEKRSLELSKVGAAWLFGSILGPFLGALVADSGAYGLGMINFVVIGLTIIVTLFFLKESHVDFKEGQQKDPAAEKKPIVSVRLLKKPLPRFLLLQSLFNRIPYFMFVTTTSLFVTIRFGFSVAQIGLFFTSVSIVNLIIRLILFPYVLRKLGDDKTVRLGFVLYLIAFTWLIFAGSVWEFALINMLMSFATSTAIDVMTGVMSHAVKKDEMGEMMGLSSAAESLTMVVGPIIGSNLLGMPNPYLFGLFGAAVAVIPLAMDFLPIRNRKHKKETI
jgi:MFS family permease